MSRSCVSIAQSGTAGDVIPDPTVDFIG